MWKAAPQSLLTRTIILVLLLAPFVGSSSMVLRVQNLLGERLGIPTIFVCFGYTKSLDSRKSCVYCYFIRHLLVFRLARSQYKGLSGGLLMPRRQDEGCLKGQATGRELLSKTGRPYGVLVRVSLSSKP